MQHDDDRPKKSWRDLDRQRDKNAHHGGSNEGSNAREERVHRSVSYRKYKTALNKLFDGGELPEALKGKLEDAGIGQDSKERKAAAILIAEASAPAQIREALESYRQQYGFPVEEDALAKLLELEDPAIVCEAIETVDRLQGEKLLKRASSLKARITTVQMTVDDDDVFAAAKRALAKL